MSIRSRWSGKPLSETSQDISHSNRRQEVRHSAAVWRKRPRHPQFSDREIPARHRIEKALNDRNQMPIAKRGKAPRQTHARHYAGERDALQLSVKKLE